MFFTPHFCSRYNWPCLVWPGGVLMSASGAGVRPCLGTAIRRPGRWVRTSRPRSHQLQCSGQHGYTATATPLSATRWQAPAPGPARVPPPVCVSSLLSPDLSSLSYFILLCPDTDDGLQMTVCSPGQVMTRYLVTPLCSILAQLVWPMTMTMTRH